MMILHEEQPASFCDFLPFSPEIDDTAFYTKCFLTLPSSRPNAYITWAQPNEAYLAPYDHLVFDKTLQLEDFTITEEQ